MVLIIALNRICVRVSLYDSFLEISSQCIYMCVCVCVYVCGVCVCVCVYYPPEVRRTKYCRVEVFWKEYFVLGTSGNKSDSKRALKSLKSAINF